MIKLDSRNMRMSGLGLVFILLCGVTQMHAQSFTGQLMDMRGEPVSYALIHAIGSGSHTHSNDQGRFTLENIEVGDTLSISHLTYSASNHIVSQLDKLVKIKMKASEISLEAITISNEKTSSDILSELDIEIKPVSSAQEILTKVPGLFIGQHAGGGKAEQIFLRGFDIDHGTDITITADGIPVNMVSHAHGQGYADLHFLIPETIEEIDFGLGPYHANKGNFNTAGYVDFKTKRRVSNNLIKVEAGQFNTQRLLSILKLVDNEKQGAYLAGEYLVSDGPFESPQNFSRLNLHGSWETELSEASSLGLSVSHFTSTWDASGQIPQRSVDNGSITRFGAIDDTEGGTTSRSNVILDYKNFLSSNSVINSKLYYSNYNFDLFSNFTFFLEDPENGDQIRQQENRNLFGFITDFQRAIIGQKFNTDLNLGVNLRADESRNNMLARTLNRTTILNRIQYGDVDEYNLAGFVDVGFNFGRLLVRPGLRIDAFQFAYLDKLSQRFDRVSASRSIISPKLNISYNTTSSLQFYAKAGRGFHSNDSRVFLTDPERNRIPAAVGVDLGAIWKPYSSLFLNVAVWNLFLEQEFVYVGDAGIVEPSGETLRRGIDFSLRYQPLEWLFFNTDINYTLARAIEEEEGNDFIPLAPDFTIKSGLTVKHPSGLNGVVDFRHLGGRAANEDNSIIAPGYTVVDLNMNYSFTNLTVGFQIQNLLNTEWNETQFATESRLLNETESVEEIHFTPGVPFFFKGIVSYRF